MSRILRKLKQEEDADEEQFMIKNGGILLEKLIASSKGKYNPIRSFSAKEVNAGTDDFNRLNILRSDAFSQVYKGFNNLNVV